MSEESMNELESVSRDIELPWDMPTSDRETYIRVASKIPESRTHMAGLFKKYADLCFAAISARDAALARNQELEAALTNSKLPKMFVWHGRGKWVAMAHAYSVAEARALLLEETGTTDGSCPVRAQAVEQIRNENPTIFYSANAEFALTDSGELEEADAYSETLRKERDQLKAQLASLLKPVEGMDELLAEGIAWWKQGAPNEPGGFTDEGLKKFVNALVEHIDALTAHSNRKDEVLRQIAERASDSWTVMPKVPPLDALREICDSARAALTPSDTTQEGK